MTSRRTSLIVALVLVFTGAFFGRAQCAEPTAQRPKSALCRHVVIVIVDGLRSDALLVEGVRLPALRRLMSGAHTLNARTDADFTITSPNVTGMITGRPTQGDYGHHWRRNDDPPRPMTLHSHRGEYVASIFDIASEHRLHTAFFAGKTKFSLYETSYAREHGLPARGNEVEENAHGREGGPHSHSKATGDPAHAPRNGDETANRPLDLYVYSRSGEELTGGAIAALRDSADRGSLIVLHYARTDTVGHQSGWDITPDSAFMRAVAEVDAELARLLDAIDADENLRGRVGIILTSDHGGGAPFKHHSRAHMWVNYIIPFFVWLGDEAPTADLYELNGYTRRDPGLNQPIFPDSPDDPAAARQPIRNLDAANLALDLLGLPAVPGSLVNARQDLSVTVR